MPKPQLYRGLASHYPRLRLDLPYNKNNRASLKDICGDLTRPHYDKVDQVWEVARDHYCTIIEGCVERYGFVLVVEDYATQERGARRGAPTPSQSAWRTASASAAVIIMGWSEEAPSATAGFRLATIY